MNAKTVPEKILICAIELDTDKGTFTAEDLVVRCWQRFPDTFGLQGYAEKYPDSNRILTNIMGTKGLRGKGWLRKVGEKRYRVTETGKHAYAVNAGSDNPAERRRAAGLDRSVVEILERVFKSRALQKFRIKQQLNFGDLSAFWNVSPRSNAYQLNVAIKDTEAALSAADDLLKEAGTSSIVVPNTSVAITRSDLALVQSLQNHLKETFMSDLNVIRQRDDERLHR